MGSCLSEDPHNSRIHHQNDNSFKEDQTLQANTYRPLNSTLFNLLRKSNDLIVLQPNLCEKQNIPFFANTSNIDFQNSTLSQLKLLINSKKVLVVGDYQKLKGGLIKQLVTKSVPDKIFVIDEKCAVNFLTLNPLFTKVSWQAGRYQAAQVPILLIDSRDILSYDGKPFTLFAHNTNKRHKEVYRLMKVADLDIIAEPKDTAKIEKYYQKSIEAKDGERILMMHNPTVIDKDVLMSMLTKYLTNNFKCTSRQAQDYLSRSLPNAQINKDSNERIANQQTAKLELTVQQKFQRLFQKLNKQANPDKVERVHSILATLISNIYSNPTKEQDYRSVKKKNKTIAENITKYKYGVKLLEQLGFVSDGENWVNKMESKYLKIYRTDLQLGFKAYQQKMLQNT